MSPLDDKRAGERRAGIRRIEAPTIEDFNRAAEVCYIRWPYMRNLDSPERFKAFQDLKVELCVLENGEGVMQCVAFLVPSGLQLDGEELSWHYMFQVASRPEAAGAGALLIRQVMKLYPAIFGMGITPDAERLYRLFKWKEFSGFWRGVHPLNMSLLLQDYGERIKSPGVRRALSASAGLFNAVASVAETVVALLGTAARWLPSDGKPEALSGYLSLFECGDVRAANVGGAGRILTLPGKGSLRQHAAIWRSLREQKARFCEMLLFSEDSKNLARRVGYIPIPLQVWCWDPKDVLVRAIPALKARGFSFLDTDKVI
jgi:hypothetical protein